MISTYRYIQLTECSATFRDKLLVETYIFAIFGVSFCVTQNAFNFIEILKNKNIRLQFSKTSIPLCFPFFIDGFFGFFSVVQKHSSLRLLHCHF